MLQCAWFIFFYRQHIIITNYIIAISIAVHIYLSNRTSVYKCIVAKLIYLSISKLRYVS